MKNKDVKEIEVIENEAVEVFGTTEVSIKEFMGITDKNLVFLSNYDLAKKNLEDLKIEHEARVEKLVLIEKMTSAELKELNNILSIIRKPRYLIQNLKKDNASVLASYSKKDKSNWDELISINEPLEDKASAKVKIEDDRKKKEKEEEANAEALRIKTITDKIDEVETSCYEIIQKMTFSEIEFSKTQLFAFFTVEFDFEEYDILFDQAKSRVEVALENKVNSLTASENQRLDNIRLEEEAIELKRLADLQAERLTAIMPYVAFGQAVDLTKLSELTKGEWEVIFDSKKALFDASVLENKKIEDERIAKEEEEKEAIYVIRRKRLLELGMQYSDEHDTFFIDEENEYILLKDNICDYTAVEFEETFEEVKTVFKEASEKIEKEKVFEIRKGRLAEIGFDVETERSGFFIHPDLFDGIDADALFNLDETWFESKVSEAKLGIEKAKSDAEEAEKQKALDLKLADEDAERLKKENKARIKKYAADKKTLIEFVKSLDVRNPIPELDNVESEETLSTFMIALEDFRKEWINNVEII